ncbi:hypothetical protein L596_030555 [Steinernema carpocapsae]|uniref:Uncharacterized protein n=1 Tax=Steinernema carpocapsae TaxID=34508 RepID=A0A4U5LPP6_STECR|nr:hypothetical protein L596_030555 [Steinernema carpocapsae]
MYTINRIEMNILESHKARSAIGIWWKLSDTDWLGRSRRVRQPLGRVVWTVDICRWLCLGQGQLFEVRSRS